MREAAVTAVDMVVDMAAGTVVAIEEVTLISMVGDMAAVIFAGDILPAPVISAGMASIKSDPSRSVPIMCEAR
jgi:hypothetical protein